MVRNKKYRHQIRKRSPTTIPTTDEQSVIREMGMTGKQKGREAKGCLEKREVNFETIEGKGMLTVKNEN